MKIGGAPAHVDLEHGRYWCIDVHKLGRRALVALIAALISALAPTVSLAGPTPQADPPPPPGFDSPDQVGRPEPSSYVERGNDRAIVEVAPEVDRGEAAEELRDRAYQLGAVDATVVEGVADRTLLLEGVPPEVQIQLSNEPTVRVMQPNRTLHLALDDSTTVIGADRTRDRGLKGAGQTIAVVDTGVLATHPALTSAVVAEVCYSPYSYDDRTTVPPEDRCPNGDFNQVEEPGAAAPPCTAGQRARQNPPGSACSHGTHVAGIVAGRATPAAPNLVGVAPESSIVAMRIATGDGYMDEDALIAALEWVISNAAHRRIAAVNLSVATSEVYGGNCDRLFPIITEQVNRLTRLRVAVVVSTGNAKAGANGGIAFPACITNSVSVSASSLSDTRAPFAHVSASTSLFAPGVGIGAPVPHAVSPSGYSSMSGTSMAAPHVAGAIAVMRQAQATNLTVPQLVDVLRQTGRGISTPVGTIPRLDLAAAVGSPLAPQVVVATHGNGRATVSWSAASPGIGAPVTSYRITTVPATTTRTVAASTRSTTMTGLRNGARYQIRVQALSATGVGPARASNLVIPKAPSPPHRFPDVAASSYFDAAVRWLKAEGITGGVGSTGLYKPNDPVTRAQMAVFLWRLMGSPSGNPAHGFPDVPSASYYEQAVRWLKARGITGGVGDTGLFKPNDPVTRAQMAAFLHRLVRSPGGYGAHGFVDVPGSSYYEQPVRWLKTTGITTGVGGTNRFAPGDVVNRAQMAAFLHRLAANPAAWARVSISGIPDTIVF